MTAKPKSLRVLIRVLFLLLLLTGIVLAVIYRDAFDAQRLQAWIQDAGKAAPLLFMLIYIIGTVLFLPGSILTLLGGALFGPVAGTFYNLTAATAGAMLAFLIARYLASDWVTTRTGPRIRQLVEGVEHEGWRFVALVRLVPLFPFNLLNYALGLTRIGFIRYTLTTYICMLPGAMAYTYLGYIGKEAATGGEGLIQKSLLALALLAMVMLLPRIINSVRKQSMISVDELKHRLDRGEGMLLIDVRNANDFNGDQHHIHKAVNIPLAELAQRLDELENFIEGTVMIICRGDKMSAKAARILTRHGFTDVHVVRDGMTGWNAHGYPVE